MVSVILIAVNSDLSDWEYTVEMSTLASLRVSFSPGLEVVHCEGASTRRTGFLEGQSWTVRSLFVLVRVDTAELKSSRNVIYLI